ncbi:PREDICTED: transmembrane protein 88B [Dipodomys ordii]|uniref:Transmembrane protein 88B n=1 Tax=Dipodomys ordii TaxID=10020 RepID=A0A1S3GDE0_DIPOR|nr:PREDICTED: transmembrane protein 88B [Dipodomys ordii]
MSEREREAEEDEEGGSSDTAPMLPGRLSTRQASAPTGPRRPGLAAPGLGTLLLPGRALVVLLFHLLLPGTVFLLVLLPAAAVVYLGFLCHSRPVPGAMRGHRGHQIHQGIRGCQGIRTPGHQGIGVPGDRDTRGSGHQGIGTPGDRGTRGSGCKFLLWGPFPDEAALPCRAPCSLPRGPESLALFREPSFFPDLVPLCTGVWKSLLFHVLPP